MCHPDRSVAKWKDLLSAWLRNMLRIAEVGDLETEL
jgi:hypothetical protein